MGGRFRASVDLAVRLGEVRQLDSRELYTARAGAIVRRLFGSAWRLTSSCFWPQCSHWWLPACSTLGAYAVMLLPRMDLFAKADRVRSFFSIFECPGSVCRRHYFSVPV